MLELRRGEELALLVKVNEYRRISLFNKETRIRSFLSHLALAVNKLNKRKTVSSAHLIVILTECGSYVNDTCTVGHGYIVVSGNVVRFFVLLRCSLGSASPESLVFSALKVNTLHLLKYLVRSCALFSLKRAQHRVKKRLCHIVRISVGSLYLAVGV